MPAVVVSLGEEIKDLLNLAELSQPFIATREWIPRPKLEDLKTIAVTVVFMNTDSAGSDRRQSLQNDNLFEVGIQKQWDGSKAMADDFALFVEEMRNYLAENRLATSKLLPVTIVSAVAADKRTLEEERCIMGGIAVTYRTWTN